MQRGRSERRRKRVQRFICGLGPSHKLCTRCRKTFASVSGAHVYCSDTCRTAIRDQKIRDKCERICWCGKRIASRHAATKSCCHAHKMRRMLDGSMLLSRLEAGETRQEMAVSLACAYTTIVRTILRHKKELSA